MQLAGTPSTPDNHKQPSTPPVTALECVVEAGADSSLPPEALAGGVEELACEQVHEQANDVLKAPAISLPALETMAAAADLSVKTDPRMLETKLSIEGREHPVPSPPKADGACQNMLPEPDAACLLEKPAPSGSMQQGLLPEPSFGAIPAKRPLPAADEIMHGTFRRQEYIKAGMPPTYASAPDAVIDTPAQPAKRCKRPLEVLAKSVEDAARDLSKLNRPASGSITFGEPSVPTLSFTNPNGNGWSPSGLNNTTSTPFLPGLSFTNPKGAVWNPSGLNNTAGTIWTQPGGLQDNAAQVSRAKSSPVFVKVEPHDEPSISRSARERPLCEVDIFELFENHTFSSSQWSRLRRVQKDMEYYAADSRPSEHFNLIGALPRSITLSRKRRIELEFAQKSLDQVKARRLGNTVPSGPRRDGYRGRRSRPEVDQMPQFNVQPAELAQPTQAFNPFQDPPARAKAQETQAGTHAGYEVKPPGGYPVQMNATRNEILIDTPATLSKEVGQPVELPDLLAKSNKGTKVVEADLKHASLTVLTLPRLGIREATQTSEVAKTILEEANSLLASYSNVRLAFSAQDMRSG